MSSVTAFQVARSSQARLPAGSPPRGV